MKKLLVSIIAIVLVAAVIGTCFALYKVPAVNKTVTIDATTDTCTLTINTSESLDFSGISPENGHTTKSVNVTLSTTDNSLVDGVSGVFKVAIGDTLASYIDITVDEYDSTFTDKGDALAAATTENGATIALSTVPKYYKLTMTLNASGISSFATIADSTDTITLSWTVAEGSVFVYSSTAYYAIGKIDGVSSWNPNTARYLLTDEDMIGSNVAEAHNVHFTAGDEIKVVWNFFGENGEDSQWYGNNEGGNVTISETGYYNIFLYNDNGYKVSVAKID